MCLLRKREKGRYPFIEGRGLAGPSPACPRRVGGLPAGTLDFILMTPCNVPVFNNMKTLLTVWSVGFRLLSCAIVEGRGLLLLAKPVPETRTFSYLLITKDLDNSANCYTSDSVIFTQSLWVEGCARSRAGVVNPLPSILYNSVSRTLHTLLSFPIVLMRVFVGPVY